MKRQSIIVLAIFVGLLSGCKSSKPSGDNSQTSVDWKGVYTGVVPCGDCEGILTRITLKEDKTYTLQTTYLGKSADTHSNNGSFEWSKDGSQVKLKNIKAGTAPIHYKVGENRLVQLDQNGNEITGNTASSYVLTKGEGGIGNKYWKLVEINGQPVLTGQSNAKVPHIIFHPADYHVSGSGGCNNFSGTYKLEPNSRIALSPLAATKMACMDANMNNTEGMLFKALGVADSYTVKNDSMLLMHAGTAPLARFVSLYLH